MKVKRFFPRKVTWISRSMQLCFLDRAVAIGKVSRLKKLSHTSGEGMGSPFQGALFLNGPVTSQASVARRERIGCARTVML